MSMVAKILVFVNLVLAVMVMGAAGAYLKSAEDWRTKYNDEHAKYEADMAEKAASLKQALAAKDDAIKTKDAAEAAKAAAEMQAKTYAENNSILQRQLAAQSNAIEGVKAGIGNLEQNLAAARAENQNLQGEVARANEEKRAALDAKNAAETEQKRLEQDVANLTSQLDGSEKAKVVLAENLEKTTTLLTIYQETYPPVGQVAAPVKGMVLAADSKVGVYLISVGGGEVMMGQELTVSRGEKFVAQVVVDKVLGKDKASVMVKMIEGHKQQKMDIMQGDMVKTVN